MFEMLINPVKAEKRPWEMFFIGAFYATLSLFLTQWIFSGDPVLSKYTGMLIVTFCVMFTIPFLYFAIKYEEEKDLQNIGFMSEGLSLQGISEIPLVVYLASRVGPGTGIPTYNMQGDLDIALRAGHGEFPRIVASPGDPLESIEITNELMYLSEKFRCLSILLSDKHVAESEFSTDKKHKRPLKINITRKLPGDSIIKSSSYEQDDYGLTTESAEFAIKKWGC